MVTADALFTGSATIMALAVFGSLLGMRVEANSSLVAKLVRAVVFLMITGIVAAQMLFMTTVATDKGLITFEEWILITGGCSFVIVWLVIARPFLPQSS